MKTITKLFASVVVLILGFSANSFGQDTGAAKSSATIVTPIDIAWASDLNFGNVAVSATTGGTVILSPAGTRDKTGGVTLPAITGTVSAASFTVTGNGGYTYSILLPQPFDVKFGSITMNVHAFISDPAVEDGGTLSSGGTQTLSVGATLDVAAGQAAGEYTNASDLTVTVNYN